jgi:hypothetical protein
MKKINKKKQFIEAYIKKLGNISKACSDVNIDRGTFYNWLKEPEFKQMFDNAIEEHNDLIYSRIFKKALEEDKDMLKFWAKTQMKHRGFTEQRDIKLSGEVKTNKMTAEELRQIYEECKDGELDKRSNENTEC